MQKYTALVTHADPPLPSGVHDIYVAADIADLARRVVEDAEGLAYNRELMTELRSLMGR
jgi:hypothetical protein